MPPRKAIHFELLAQDGAARRGRFQTEHGEVQCPTFMPVGTQGAVKTVTPHQVAETGAQVVLANTFHMSLEDRPELARRVGGLHRLMAWDRSILTDSGGFQVFSIPDKTVSEEGVTFQYPKAPAPILLTPESSMGIQRVLGADIVMAFDECVEYPAAAGRVAESLERTTRWARRCREVELAPHQFLFGIVQGGTYPDLRRRSAEQIRGIDFDGFAIGGVSVGEGLALLKSIVGITAPLLPANLPRYLMGVGLPEDIFEAVGAGMDMFDCVVPTRYARGATLFTRVGKIRLGDKRYRKDKYPIDRRCTCYTCQHFSRMVLRHLHYAGEALFATLATIHNLQFYQDMMADIRKAIEERQFFSFRDAWLLRYHGGE
jgi:queuine tRNA-ribosyltransferase